VSHPPLPALVEPGWARALAPVADRIAALQDLLAAEPGHLPPPGQVLRAFEQPFADVRVLVVGQDPYPTPGHAVGLSFSVAPGLRPLPRSLANVFTELVADVGTPRPVDGDLTPWTRQGVLLLNRVLSVRPGEPGSHRGRGWEEVTDRAVTALVERGGPLVAVLWGRDAQSLRPLLAGVPTVESAHPSPMSAARGFFGSRPFSRVNALLAEQGAAPVDWSLRPAATVVAADGTMGA
jgi:uracil-DNA glycosylase